MGESANDHLSWSVRLDRDDAAQRAFDGFVELVRDRLQREFPPACGYETEGRRLAGPLEGVHWRVTRGSFVAELGVQRFVRAHGAAGSPRAWELRMVASAGLDDDASDDPQAAERRIVAWALAGWGLGSVALGAALLGASGLVAGWAQALLLVPAVAAWRLSVASLVRRASDRTRALGSPCSLALASPQVEDGRRRWRRLLPELREQRDRIQGVRGSPPFRSVGHVGTATPEADAELPAALAAGSSLTWARAALSASEANDRAIARPGRTRHTRWP